MEVARSDQPEACIGFSAGSQVKENPLWQRYLVAKGKRLTGAFAAICGKPFWQDIQNCVF